MAHFPDNPDLQDAEVHPNAERVARATADHFVTLASRATARRGRFAVALAGGSTPKAAYSLLATDEFATCVDWSKVQVFWGDERCVPPDHADSNYRMAREALIDRVPLPASNVHRIRGELGPSQAASDYEKTLRLFLDSHSREGEAEARVSPPRFDLILLGMGDDGHTASLFPGTKAIHEQTRWVLAHYVEKLDAWRITLTPVIVNAAMEVTFVVTGSAKAERLRQVLTGPYRPDALPAQIVSPDPGHVRWLLDEAAATSLRDNS
jgi:6-phosphogluconolactonase